MVVLEFTSCNVIPMGQGKKPTSQLHLVRWRHQLLIHEVPIPYYFTWHSNTTVLLLEHWFTKLWFVPTATVPTTTCSLLQCNCAISGACLHLHICIVTFILTFCHIMLILCINCVTSGTMSFVTHHAYKFCATAIYCLVKLPRLCTLYREISKIIETWPCDALFTYT